MCNVLLTLAVPCDVASHPSDTPCCPAPTAAAVTAGSAADVPAEVAELQAELELLRAKVESHPEVKRFAVENLHLSEVGGWALVGGWVGGRAGGWVGVDVSSYDLAHHSSCIPTACNFLLASFFLLACLPAGGEEV